MSEEAKRPLDINGLIKEDAEKKKGKQQRRREIKLREYLDMVKNDPSIAQNAPNRLLEAVMSYGVEEISETDQSRLFYGKDIKRRYKLFSETLYGLETPISQLVDFWRAGTARLSTGKQVLLIVGPTSSGKSTIADLLKKALVEFKKPIFGVKGCPIREEPLHLLPRKTQEEFAGALGIRVEGDLCPVCRNLLLRDFKADDGVIRWWDVPVEQFSFSERSAKGIASYEPSDDKSSSMTDLTGKENLAVIADPKRGMDDPLAYILNGELCKANRGLFEGVELIKNDEKVLWVFISLAEEQRIKVSGSGFPHITIDTNIIGHTNLTEYNKFSNNKSNEALHDRIYVVSAPYALRVNDEVKIYRKLIEKDSDLKRLGDRHIAPGSLEIAATFAVLTRLQEKNSQQVGKLLKMKLYNGEHGLTELDTQETMSIDVYALRREGQSNHDISKREGMTGVSPRDVLSAINVSLAKQNTGCLTPLTVLRALRDFADHRMGYSAEEKESFKQLLSSIDGDSVIREYKDYALAMVSKAYLRAYDDLARELFRKYVREVEFERSQKRKFLGRHLVEAERDPRTGEPREVDVKLMRSIEQFIPIDDSMAQVFRGEILEVKASSLNFSYDTYRPLAQAVEKKLLSDSRETLTLVLSEDKLPNEEVKRRGHDLRSALKEGGREEAHCDICAKELMEQAAEFLKD